MGCDIHPFLEAKIQGKWIYIGNVLSYRNYVLFNKLSGVRGDGIPFFPSFQIDAELSKEVKEELEGWGNDAHSLTVCYAEKLKEFCEKYAPNLTKEEFEGLRAKGLREKNDEMKWQEWWGSAGYCVEWLEMMQQLIMCGCEDARVILWYDN